MRYLQLEAGVGRRGNFDNLYGHFVVARHATRSRAGDGQTEQNGDSDPRGEDNYNHHKLRFSRRYALRLRPLDEKDPTTFRQFFLESEIGLQNPFIPKP